MFSRPAAQKIILVIEDEPDILEFLSDLLSLEGFRVVLTGRGEDLERVLSTGFPDLILLDVFLSGKDGRNIARHLKSQEQTRCIPIIMFSAYPGTEASAQATGADDFLPKPFDMDILLSKIRAILFQ